MVLRLIISILFSGFPDNEIPADESVENDMDIEVEDREEGEEEVESQSEEHGDREAKTTINAKDQIKRIGNRLDDDGDDESERGGEEGAEDQDQDQDQNDNDNKELGKRTDDTGEVEESYWKSDVEVNTD